MRWKREGVRDLRLVEITPEEEQTLLQLLQRMRAILPDAKTMTDRLEEDVLRGGCLKNRKLSRQETLAQLSTWCHASAKHKGVKPCAQEVCKLLFAGNVIQRLVDKKTSQCVNEGERLLDTFIETVIAEQDAYTYPDIGTDPVIGPEDDENEQVVESLPTSVTLERDLRDHIAHDPSVIEPDLRLCTGGIEYKTDVGSIDVLCEDSRGNLVVIELKKNRSGDQVVGQILRYMGWLLKEKKGREIRGIIVMGEPDERTTYAVCAIPNVEIMYYRVRFEISEDPPV